MGACACIYDGDGEQADFSTTEIVKARKSHKCGECGQTIAAGQKYERVFGKWEGRVSTFKTCFVCVEIRGALFCDGWTYGMIWERIEESWGEKATNPLGCINELETVAAKEMLGNRYREWLEV